MKTTIELDNMQFYAHHGVMEQERVVGNNFSISLKLEADLRIATESDALDDTISYADVSRFVQNEIVVPSQLLEHVAGRIYRILKTNFPQITKLEVKLYKQNPPGCGETERAGVVLSDW